MIDPTLLLVLVGVTIFGLSAGMVGSFAFFNKHSLLADAISHAAFPGVGLALLLSGDAHPLYMLIGSCVMGCFATAVVMVLTIKTRLKVDTILGVVLSSFFGAGLVIATVVQKQGVAHQGIINKFLFGCAATLLPRDLYVLVATGLIALMTVFCCWRPFVMLTFDDAFAQVVGMRVWLWRAVLISLLVMVIAAGLQTVGVVLMSALCVAPAAAMRQWTSRTVWVVLGAGVSGALAASVGAYISSVYAQVPTGPAIAICAIVWALVSLLCAPARGVLWARVRYAKGMQ